MKKTAFTLAEVLITLGIIGVVAAMTLPTLIQKNNNRVVETRLKKFYSAVNQAILLAENDYGSRKYWYQDINNIETDKDGNPVNGSSTVEKWWNKYMAPYIKTVDIKYDEEGLPIFMFADGSGLKASQTDAMRDWEFYIGDPEKCTRKTGSYEDSLGKCVFRFLYMPDETQVKDSYNYVYHINKGFEPYKYYWDGTKQGLINGSRYGCTLTKEVASRAYCTALIQYNGWEIPDEYPLKVSY